MVRRLLFLFALLAPVAAIAGEPFLTLFIGGGPGGAGPNYFLAIERSGEMTVRRTSLPFVAPRTLTETRTHVHLSAAERRRILRLARAATDFSDGCDPRIMDGTIAKLTIPSQSETITRECRNGGRWPVGPDTKALFEAVNRRLPEKFRLR